MYIPKKVPPMPTLFYNTPCKLYLQNGKVNRYGEADTKELELKCKFTQKTKRILTEERKIVVIEATALIDGGQLLLNVIDSDFAIYETKYKVYTCKGIRNPDGSIHHWKLELI
jgi:hypothetical protein